MATMPHNGSVLSEKQRKELKNLNKYRYYKKIRKDGFGRAKTVPYSRRLAIKYYCMECVGFVHDEMKNCTTPECPFFEYRFGKLPQGKTVNNRAKAIRGYCLNCVSDDQDYIAHCLEESSEKLCPIHPYRLAGYKTDTSSLIPANKIESLPEYEEGFEDYDGKTED